MVVLSNKIGPSFSKCFIILSDESGSESVRTIIVSELTKNGSLIISAAACANEARFGSSTAGSGVVGGVCPREESYSLLCSSS